MTLTTVKTKVTTETSRKNSFNLHHLFFYPQFHPLPHPTFSLHPNLFYRPSILPSPSISPSFTHPQFYLLPPSHPLVPSYSIPPSHSVLPSPSVPPAFTHPPIPPSPSHPLHLPANVEIKKGRQPDPNDRASCWRSFKKFSRRVFCYCCCCCCGRGREKDFLVVRRNLFESRQKLKGFFPVIHDGVREDAKHR